MKLPMKALAPSRDPKLCPWRSCLSSPITSPMPAGCSPASSLPAQHFLYLIPLPQGQRSFLPIFIFPPVEHKPCLVWLVRRHDMLIAIKINPYEELACSSGVIFGLRGQA